MKYQFLYKEDEHFKIQNIMLVGDFNQWDIESTELEKDGNGNWVTEVELEPGTYTYKFYINHGLYLNDPIANLYGFNDKKELVSCIKIDEDGKRLYNLTTYNISITKCLCSDKRDEQISYDKGRFSLNNDSEVNFNLAFKDVTGLHTVTVVWCSEDERYCTYNEGILFLPEGVEEESLWFTLNLTNGEVTSGVWKIKVLIDGKFILERAIFILEDKQVNNIEKLLPIGSVVLLKGASKRLMISGRMQRAEKGGEIYDYSGYSFPEGNISSNQMFLFSHNQIERIIHMGLQDEEEEDYKRKLLGYFS